jgi:N6-adenosine-specific RNA methylase IME4
VEQRAGAGGEAVIHHPLAAYDAACRAIRAAATVDEAKDIKDQATALAAYARQRNNPDLEIQAAEIRARARRRIGEISAALEKVVTNSRGWENVIPKASVLSAAGISTSEADRCEDIASIPEEEVEALFAECRERGKPVSSDELLRKVQRNHKRKARLANLKTAPFPEGKYRVIYTDNPWLYGNDLARCMAGSTSAVDHYPTMSIDELCALEVNERHVSDLAMDDAVMFMWVPAPLLYEAAPVIPAWGFVYKTLLVWDKVRHNVGHYVSSRCELLLICTRGSCTRDADTLLDNVVSVVSIDKSTVHSRKPDCFREIIDGLYPHGPRIELFARQRHEGWDAWGNEVPDPDGAGP